MCEVWLFGAGAVLSSFEVGFIGCFRSVRWAVLLELAGVQEECLVASLWVWPVWNALIGDVGLRRLVVACKMRVRNWALTRL